MKKNVTIGIALVAAAIMALALGASAASASGLSAFTKGTGAEQYPTTVTGNGRNEVSWGGWGIAMCTTGRMTASLGAPSKSVAFEPECGGQIQPNGCRLIAHAGTETAPGVFAASVSVGGPECSGMAIRTEGTSLKCYGTIPAQGEVPGSTLRNVEGSPDKVELTLNASLKGVGGGGALGCPKSGANTSAIWVGSLLLEAKSPGGEARDLKAASSIVTGIAFEEGQFVGERYPATLSGAQTGSQLSFTAGSGFGSIACSTVNFGALLASASSSLATEAAYSGCADSFSRQVTVLMHSCDYVLNGSGVLGVSCSSPEDAIEYQIASGSKVVCTTTVPAQNVSSALSYETSGAGYAATVKANIATGSLTTTTTGGLLNCGIKNGTHTEGHLTGAVKFAGSAEYQ